MGRHVSPKRRSIFNGLHGFVSQKAELFVTFAVRTSNSVIQNYNSYELNVINHHVIKIVELFRSEEAALA
jgi:hypothetical protein